MIGLLDISKRLERLTVEGQIEPQEIKLRDEIAIKALPHITGGICTIVAAMEIAVDKLGGELKVPLSDIDAANAGTKLKQKVDYISGQLVFSLED